jgi:hypothetical protein
VHDGDIGAPRIERRETIAVDEPRRFDERQRGAHGAVEPLDVPRLHQRARARRDREQLIGLGERCRDRLLDQQVTAAFERGPRDGEMRGRRHGDRERVARIDQLVDGLVCPHAEFRRHLLRAFRAGVVEADHRRALDVAQQPNVMVA